MENISDFYLSFEGAQKACPDSGYSNNDLLQVIVEKNIIFRDRIQQSLPPLFDLSVVRTILGISLALTGKKLTVLDFGGGAGYHYFVARAALSKDIALDWRVIETPSMVSLAKSRISDVELHFFDSIQSAKSVNANKIDLTFASSSLQYCPDPLAILNELTGIGATHLFITRTPFSENDQFITIQKSRLKDNGPGPLPDGFNDCEISYPITFVAKSNVEEILKDKYSIRFSIEEQGRYFLTNQQVITSQYGFFCDLHILDS